MGKNSKKEKELNGKAEEENSANPRDKDKPSGFGEVMRKWTPLFVLSLSLAIILIDVTLLNVALSTIIQDFNTTIQKIQWVITAYSLTIAALMITGGRLGDLYGRKKMFMLGAFIFAVGSFICSVSGNVPTMIVGESIIEGIGAALMMPATLSLLISTYRGRDRAIAFGIWGGVAGAATAIGPLLGGWITSNFSWRWAFRINVFVAAVLLIGAILIKESREHEERPELDWVGVILSSSGLFFIVFGVIESSTYGWVKATEPFSLFGWVTFGTVSICLYSIVTGIVIFSGFLLWERRMERNSHTPLVSLRLFRNSQFVSGTLMTGIVALGQAGLVFSLPVFLQAVRGLDAFHTGLALVPMSIGSLVFAPLAGVISNRIGAKIPIQVGLLVLISGYVYGLLIWNVNSTPVDFIPNLLLVGAGMGMMMGQTNNITLSAVSVEQSGEASGVNNTGRQLGMTLGTAIIGAVVVASISSAMISGVKESRVIPEPFKANVEKQVNEQASNIEFGGGAKLPDYIPVKIKEEIVSISHKSVTKASRNAILIAAGFTMLAFLASFMLPGRSRQKQDGESLASHDKQMV